MGVSLDTPLTPLDPPLMAVTMHQMWELSAIHKVYDMCMEMAVSIFCIDTINLAP